MATQYVMANILIPIEILEDESFELMPEYISIQIENCNKLPEKKNLTNVQTTLLEQIRHAIEKKHLLGEQLQLPKERPSKKRPQNITFKRYSSASSRNTIRNFESDYSDTSGSEETDSDLEISDDEEPRNTIISNDKQVSNPLIREDKDADSSQLQEVQELEPEGDQLHLNLKADEYLE
jgi:hypothetical protein